MALFTHRPSRHEIARGGIPAQEGGFGAVRACWFYRIPYAERELATESGDAQWPYLPTGLTVTKLPVGASPPHWRGSAQGPLV